MTVTPTVDVGAPMKRLLDFIVAYWDRQGWALPVDDAGNVCAYMAAGNPDLIADDNPAVVVSLTQMRPGPATPREGIPAKGTGSVLMMTATFEVRLMRRTPMWDERSPSQETIEASAQELMTDPGRLLTTLVAWCHEEPISVSRNGPRQVGEVRPEGPNGGHVGHSATVTISPVQ